jgi:uncharacterized membrane protein YvbJ
LKEKIMANCSNCGKPLKEGVKFCVSCGTAVKGGAAAKPAAATKSAAAKPVAAPARSAAPDAATDEVITTLGWIGTFLVLIIPIVGLVLYFVWAFGSGNLNRRNYCRASLIMMAISIGLGIIFSVVIALAYQSIFSSIRMYM